MGLLERSLGLRRAPGTLRGSISYFLDTWWGYLKLCDQSWVYLEFYDYTPWAYLGLLTLSLLPSDIFWTHTLGIYRTFGINSVYVGLCYNLWMYLLLLRYTLGLHRTFERTLSPPSTFWRYLGNKQDLRDTLHELRLRETLGFTRDYLRTGRYKSGPLRTLETHLLST